MTVLFNNRIPTKDKYKIAQTNIVPEQSITETVNIYEEAMSLDDDGDWEHNMDILFDADAVVTIEEAESAGRSFTSIVDLFTGDETYKYYNRGIIVDIPKERLEYLPKKEKMYNFTFNKYRRALEIKKN